MRAGMAGVAGWLEGCILRMPDLGWVRVGNLAGPAHLTPGKLPLGDRVSVSGLRWEEQGALVQGPGSKVIAFGGIFFFFIF